MPGIREAIYLGGTTIARGPGSVTEQRQDAKTEQRLRDGSLVSHYLSPSTGDPDLLTKCKWVITWTTLCDADVAAITRLVSAPGAFDFCPWTPCAEQWTFAAGASYAGKLLRRSALAVVSPLPPNAATKYALAGTLNGTTATITLGATTGTRTAWSSTGTATAGDIVSILYYPVYSVKLTNQEPSYSLPVQQGWSLTLEEV